MSSFTLDQVVPWGRSMDEYQRLFDLSEDDLQRRILDCAGGPASFNSEMTKLGRDVLSIDPIYTFSSAQIEQRVHETAKEMVVQLEPNLDEYVWDYFGDVHGLIRHRLAAMQLFLDDLEQGKVEGRYQVCTLPETGLADQSFGIALCSHFLFLYTEQLSYDFHLAGILELCRVAEEVRIFPLMALDCRRSAYVDPIREALGVQGLVAEILPVAYEFQRGGSWMMRIKSEQ
ncbi:MAG: SAM-dependent methyltransferase [Chloroflexota bacterium]